MWAQGIDEYSNILYVKEQPAALSHLAHRVSLDDKYRPETCCIIGNYYSLNNMHEKVGAACVPGPSHHLPLEAPAFARMLPCFRLSAAPPAELTAVPILRGGQLAPVTGRPCVWRWHEGG